MSCPNCQCSDCSRARSDAANAALGRKFAAARPHSNCDGLEVRITHGGAFITFDTIKFRRMSGKQIAKRRTQHRDWEERWRELERQREAERRMEQRKPKTALERRRRLRDLHPDHLGREQTATERAEFTELATFTH